MKVLWQVGIGLCFLCSCTTPEADTPFRSLPPDQTGIHFVNEVTDSPDFNILDYLYFYNGGGVAAGDINNDGLPDLYLTANQGPDKLYLNKGNFRFEDISDRFDDESALSGWSTGVTMVDVNRDGWLDIYVCRLGQYRSFDDRNKLFINQHGNSFVESAAKYGLDFSGFATQAAFLDYDRDGDLDCYLLNHSVKDPEQFKEAEVREVKDSLAGDRFLENQNGSFVDVTGSTGIFSSSVGFGLGIDVADLNGDGWLDIYVGNDFHENDYLYLNEQDKSFREVINYATGHTSNFSMGCTIDDLNNDLHPDILTLDMKPYDEVIYKKSGGWESLEIYNFKRRYGYHHQSPRNALQIYVGEADGIPVFSEQAAYYGLEATDWSWSPLAYDFDNDGDKDLLVTNGILRRPNDMDFVKFHFDPTDPDRLNQVEKMPKGNVPNLYFENDFQQQSFNRTSLGEPLLSTGAAVADFNQDGHLDVVINNINAPASVLSGKPSSAEHHYVRIALNGEEANRFGIGSIITLYQGGKAQMNQIKSSSGFQSFSEPVAHFGFSATEIDSVKVTWPDGTIQVEQLRTVDTIYRIDKSGHTLPASFLLKKALPIKNVTTYNHIENDFNDQQANKWLLYQQSTFGPRMAPVDEQHIYFTGNKRTSSGVLNTSTNTFTPFDNKKINIDENQACVVHNKAGAIPYLFVTHGGNELKTGDERLQDALYQWGDSLPPAILPGALPALAYHTAVCAAHDYDQDGDEDIFVGVHSDPGQYGASLSSYLLINEAGNFTQKALPTDGMVYDATWADIDGNGWADLIVTGHWMPISILFNDGEALRKYTLPETAGLWNSVHIADIDGNGKPDIVAGNYGLNHSLSASTAAPLTYYLNDFDNNGQAETLVTYYVDRKEVPYPNQSLFAAQIPGVQKHFLKYTDFANARIAEIVDPALLQEAISKKVVELRSACFLQTNAEQWTKKTLPNALQMSPIWAIEQMDDVFFFGGNFYGIDPNWGRQDAIHLSAFQFLDGGWVDRAEKLGLPIVKGEIRDLLFQDKKLYIALNNDHLKIIDFTELNLSN